MSSGAPHVDPRSLGQGPNLREIKGSGGKGQGKGKERNHYTEKVDPHRFAEVYIDPSQVAEKLWITAGTAITHPGCINKEGMEKIVKNLIYMDSETEDLLIYRATLFSGDYASAVPIGCLLYTSPSPRD